MNAHVRELRFYAPVDLLLRFETPDGIGRTKHMGVFQLVSDALEAAATYGITEWLPAGADGKKRSKCGGLIIQPVST